jgi:hypothetical protein
MAFTSYYGSLPEPLQTMQSQGPLLLIFLRHFG